MNTGVYRLNSRLRASGAAASQLCSRECINRHRKLPNLQSRRPTHPTTATAPTAAVASAASAVAPNAATAAGRPVSPPVGATEPRRHREPAASTARLPRAPRYARTHACVPPDRALARRPPLFHGTRARHPSSSWHPGATSVTNWTRLSVMRRGGEMPWVHFRISLPCCCIRTVSSYVCRCPWTLPRPTMCAQ